MSEHARVIDFMYELGLLKRSRRAGWWIAGIKDPETIAEHSFRTAIVGFVLAQLAGADAYRTALMCLMHDTQETRLGDVPSVGKPYVRTTSNVQVTDDQTSGFPGALRNVFRSLVDEYEDNRTPEAEFAHDADKLELVIQAREYQTQNGCDTTEWITNSVAKLKTPVARELAELAIRVPPERWWHTAMEANPADAPQHGGD